MPCTTLLVGKKATYDGSTMIARNEDSGGGHFNPKKFIAVLPADQPRHYKSVLTGFETDLPDNPLRYTAMPNAIPDEGVWGAAGFNSLNVAMTATETITSNSRVQGADPLNPDGLGEEDLVTVVLPYIRSAREGVLRLGGLLETFGTCEMNGIAFSDDEEIWWLESIGGHHWIARRVPDDCYVTVPNQMGIDCFDLTDAFGAQKEHLCSPDLIPWMEKYHLDLTPDAGPLSARKELDARAAFGSHDDSDHVYNTPRAWAMQRYLNPHDFSFESDSPVHDPEDDDIPWCRKPEKKITVDDVKYVLSSHFQGTPYDPYAKHGDLSLRHKYRPIGINRNNFLSLHQLRPDCPAPFRALEWVAMSSNPFNAFVPFYANVNATPEYFSGTSAAVTTESFYWANRIIAALADAHYPVCASLIERYQKKVHREGLRLIHLFDEQAAGKSEAELPAFLEGCNQQIADMARKETDALLDKVLFEASLGMQNRFNRSDA